MSVDGDADRKPQQQLYFEHGVPARAVLTVHGTTGPEWCDGPNPASQLPIRALSQSRVDPPVSHRCHKPVSKPSPQCVAEIVLLRPGEGPTPHPLCLPHRAPSRVSTTSTGPGEKYAL